MSTFAFLHVSIQVCLIQTVYSSCIGAGIGRGCDYVGGYDGLGYDDFECGGLGYGGLGYEGLGYGVGIGEYGGSGIVNVAVAGELPVTGTTAVARQVPIIGGVEYGGRAIAAGCVSITGRCGNGYLY